MNFAIESGVPPLQRDAMASLYWRVFRGKLRQVMGPDPKALAYIGRVMRPDHAISAVASDGRVLGVVGFKTAEAAFVGGSFTDLEAVYGRVGALWRAAMMAALQREVENNCFILDGIVVRDDCRGCGIGAALLDAICSEARVRGFDEVRLDVIGENLRARALYERKGFVARETTDSLFTAAMFGFRSATKMTKRL